MNGIENFFKEYCQLVFNEDYDNEAQWNYADYFIEPMEEEIKAIDNPIDLEWWDELY